MKEHTNRTSTELVPTFTRLCAVKLLDIPQDADVVAFCNVYRHTLQQLKLLFENPMLPVGTGLWIDISVLLITHLHSG